MSGPRAAALKLLGLAALGGTVFVLRTALPLFVPLLGVGLLALRARIPPSRLWGQLRAAAPVVVATVFAHALVAGTASATTQGLRLVVLLSAAALVNLTTRVTDVISVAETLSRPLRVFGIDPARVGLAFALTLRLVPLLGEIAGSIREAQRARAVERPGLTMIVPMLVATLRMADGFADALDARGLADPRPTRAR